MRCQRVNKQLALFVGNDLAERKKRSIESHLKHCSICMDHLAELKKSQDQVRELAMKDRPDLLPPDFPERITKNLRPPRPDSPLHVIPRPARVAGIFALGICLAAVAVYIVFSPGQVSSDRLVQDILSVSETGSSELVWDPEHVFFKAFDGPFRLDSWEAPRQSGVYVVLHKAASEGGPLTYIVDYCGEGRSLSSYRGYPWIRHRMKRLISRTGSAENVYIAVFLMPDSSRQERLKVEEALLKTFNPYFNRGV